MEIFQAPSTPQWANLAKSLRDAKMASISTRNALAKVPDLRGAHFGPICSPFWRLRRAGNEFTA
jgi:hypothetical protein